MTQGFKDEKGNFRPTGKSKGISETHLFSTSTDVIKIPYVKVQIIKNDKKIDKQVQDTVKSLLPKVIEMNKLEDHFRLQTHKYDYNAYLDTVKKMMEIQKKMEDDIKRNGLDSERGIKTISAELKKQLSIFDPMKPYCQVPFDSMNQKWNQEQIKYLKDKELLIKTEEDYERLKSKDHNKITSELMKLEGVKN